MNTSPTYASVLHRLAAGEAIDGAELLAGKYRQQMERVTTASNSAFSSKLLGQVTSMATGLLSAGSAVQLVRRELNLLREASERVNATQVGAAQARETLKQNIAVLPAAQRTAFLARADKLGSSLGQDQNVIDVALADAFSGSGGNVNAAFSNVRAAAGYNPNSPGNIAVTAGGLSDVSKATNRVDPAFNLGVLNKVGAASRVIDPKKQLLAIPKTMGGLANSEFTYQESGAMFAALSNRLVDPEGNTTRTAALNFGSRLEQFVAEAIKSGKVAGNVDTFGERLQAVRSNKSLADDFLGSLGGPIEAQGELEQFVRSSRSPLAMEFSRVKQSLADEASIASHGRGLLDWVGSGKFSRAASTELVVAAGSDKVRRVFADAELSLNAANDVYDLLGDTSSRVRTGKLGRSTNWFPRATTEAGIYSRVGETMSRSEAIAELDNRVRELERISPAVPRGSLTTAERTAWHLQQNDPAFASETNEMLEELRAMRSSLVELQERAATAAERTADAVESADRVDRGSRQE
ncbi:hypothetical protein Pla123a_28800 [Posidoniimonas polymericola]|uniref:Phage-related minor tail protein n=1 Tax=Posidoniimonas polymericola TaxID=2528002 RepID=A0A5C5YM98_9BACT|nr:hypothetical protein [Posidoniimonas polymericola]TWT76091.1 hypothetical protein Pla123a_28800 [Posidoniimonas polymericola]